MCPRFRDLPVFKQELETLIGWLKDTPVKPGKEVLYPGEPEARMEAERRKTGLPLAENTVDRMQEEMDQYHVPVNLKEMGRTHAPERVKRFILLKPRG